MPVHEYHSRRVVAGLIFAIIGLGFMIADVNRARVDLVWVWPLVLIGLGIASMLGRAQRIKVEEDRSAQLAVAEERVRIARELHDIVAHSVSLMTVQIAAARRVGAKKPKDADAALQAAEQTGRESLAELRSIVGVLRGADASIEAASLREVGRSDDPAAPRLPLPGLPDMKDLVDGVRDTGLDVTYSVLGPQPEVSAAMGLAVYRVVQEALTNILRHAPAAKAEVSLMYLPDAIDVRVEDTGGKVGATSAARSVGPAAPAGHGLVGMRERVAAAGGAVTAGPMASGGWQVHAEFPMIYEHVNADT